MDVTWAATSPSSGRFVSSEVTTDVGELRQRYDDLQLRGRGYLEIRRSGEFPVVTLGFEGETAVIHLFADPDNTYVLTTTDPRNAGLAIVPIMDEPTEFTPEFVHDGGRAWVGVETFAKTGDAMVTGEWCAT